MPPLCPVARPGAWPGDVIRLSNRMWSRMRKRTATMRRYGTRSQRVRLRCYSAARGCSWTRGTFRLTRAPSHVLQRNIQTDDRFSVLPPRDLFICLIILSPKHCAWLHPTSARLPPSELTREAQTVEARVVEHDVSDGITGDEIKRVGEALSRSSCRVVGTASVAAMRVQ
jgi:hypothetical protein